MYMYIYTPMYHDVIIKNEDFYTYQSNVKYMIMYNNNNQSVLERDAPAPEHRRRLPPSLAHGRVGACEFKQ